jgi:hypothetical protein
LQTSSIKTVTKSRAEKDFDNIIEKCKTNGWLNVIDYLRDKATNSTKTAVSYWTGITHLNDFIESQYNHGYSVQTIIEPLKQERIDIYELLRLFKQYMIYEYPKISESQITVGSVIKYIKSAKSYFMSFEVDDAIRFVSSKTKENLKSLSEDKEESNEPDYDEDKDQLEEEQEEETGELRTTINQVF